MSSTISGVRETFVSGINWIVENGVSVGRKIVDLTQSAYATATPHVQSLIERVKEIDFKAIAHAVKSFLQSDAGIASICFVAAGICAIKFGNEENSKLQSLLWGISAVAVAAFGAVLLINPALLHPGAAAIKA